MPNKHITEADLEIGLLVWVRKSPLKPASWEMITEVSETWHDDGVPRKKRFRVAGDSTWYPASWIDRIMYENKGQTQAYRKALDAARANARAR